MRYKFRYIIIALLMGVWGCSAVRVKEVSSPSRDFTPVIAKARKLYKSGAFKQATEIVNGLLQIDAENPLIYELKGEILLDKGEYRKAVRNFKKAVELNPVAFSAFFKKGIAHDMLKEEKESIHCFKKGIEIFRDYSPKKKLDNDVIDLAEEATRRAMKTLPPTEIAILDFEGDVEATEKNYNRFISGALIKQLSQKHRTHVKDRRKLSKFLEKYSLGMLAKPEESLKIGKLLDVDWIVIGIVYHDLDSYQIGFKMLEVSTGTIAYEDTVSFISKKDIETRCREIAEKIAVHTI